MYLFYLYFTLEMFLGTHLLVYAKLPFAERLIFFHSPSEVTAQELTAKQAVWTLSVPGVPQGH